MMAGLLDRFRKGLAKTRSGILGRIRDVVRRRPTLDESAIEELEEILIQADVGVGTSLRILDRLRDRVAEDGPQDDPGARVEHLLQQEILEILRADPPVQADPHTQSRPRVVLVVGVNGVGKTTTIGKIAARLTAEGNSVMLAACDTFRAAAIDQLDIWAERSGAQIVRHKPGADAASVAFDALNAARAREIDVVLIDTAGRLHTKINLMEELKKIRRVLQKNMPDAPHETLLVLDATTGQNAVAQARQFHEDLELTGLVLAKLDGTAKGGIVIAIAGELGLPVRYVGLGEGVHDLADFDAEAFARALFEEDA